ncbi:hypothetical protein M413DRAFT_25597 [Hebeloma cylindrosporum]|uniref:F-box domain-containing protein n=1 Tax=Hebeloma cylindrosporum TaxID=76867 RepID=A0A0C3CK67_HEBCY|nr:hypothetical protein M413DRAFT_25597 [Hebeloma cylindrosporum h7]
MFTTLDLPVELWLEILSYLPKSALHKLIGINRLLFELALDDIYEEVRFITDDKQTEKIFLQMERFPSIAKRVRRLLIRPTFLPAMDAGEAGGRAHSSRARITIKERLFPRSNLLKYNPFEPRCTVEGRRDLDTGYILQLAEKAIKLCPDLQDLTVILHDHMLTKPFISFLKSLWKSDSPLMNPQKVLRSLESFSIDLAPSRFEAIPKRAEEATNSSHRALVSLRSFFSLFRDSITSISISTHSAHYFRTLITYLPLRFPNLKKLEVLTIFKVSAHQTAPLFKFLDEHSGQLEHLTIKPFPRQTSFGHTDDWYAIWISPSPPSTLVGEHSFGTGFARLVLPKLQYLDIGLRYRRIQHVPHWANPNVNAKLLPNLNMLAPNLRHLVLSDVALSLERVDDLVESLSDDGGSGCGLESMDIIVTMLSPHIFDVLSAKLPGLKKLTIQHWALSDVRTQETYNELMLSFLEAIRARRYPGWMLRYLRLTMMATCGKPHPNMVMMKGVAEALSSGVELDGRLRCGCIDNFTYA